MSAVAKSQDIEYRMDTAGNHQTLKKNETYFVSLLLLN